MAMFFGGRTCPIISFWDSLPKLKQMFYSSIQKIRPGKDFASKKVGGICWHSFWPVLCRIPEIFHKTCLKEPQTTPNFGHHLRVYHISFPWRSLIFVPKSFQNRALPVNPSDAKKRRGQRWRDLTNKYKRLWPRSSRGVADLHGSLWRPKKVFTNHFCKERSNKGTSRSRTHPWNTVLYISAQSGKQKTSEETLFVVLIFKTEQGLKIQKNVEGTSCDKTTLERCSTNKRIALDHSWDHRKQHVEHQNIKQNKETKQPTNHNKPKQKSK